MFQWTSSRFFFVGEKNFFLVEYNQMQFLAFWVWHTGNMKEKETIQCFGMISNLEKKTMFSIKNKVETTELHLVQHSFVFHAKGLFLIDNGTFLKVRHVKIVFIITSYSSFFSYQTFNIWFITFLAHERSRHIYDSISSVQRNLLKTIYEHAKGQWHHIQNNLLPWRFSEFRSLKIKLLFWYRNYRNEKYLHLTTFSTQLIDWYDKCKSAIFNEYIWMVEIVETNLLDIAS